MNFSSPGCLQAVPNEKASGMPIYEKKLNKEILMT